MLISGQDIKLVLWENICMYQYQVLLELENMDNISLADIVKKSISHVAKITLLVI